MLYDITGSVLSHIYDVEGSELTYGYDVEGALVYDNAPVEPEPEPEPPTPVPVPTPTPTQTQYAISNVVDYYRASTEALASTLNGLSSSWQSFVFIPDIHSKSNRKHSQAIAMYLADNTPANMIVLGGDYCKDGWNKNEYTQYVKPFLDSGFRANIFPLVGNHEVIGGNINDAKKTLFSDFLSGKTNVHGSPSNGYYYVDDKSLKIRYMFLNTSDGGYQVVGDTQLAWIRNNVSMPDNTWHLVVLGHVNLDDLGGITDMNLENPAEVISNILVTNGVIVGYFCGHQHIDDCRSIGSLYQTIMLNDKLENIEYYSDLSVTNRVAGTTTEQAVSVVSINRSTRTVIVRRIGAGWTASISSLTYTY